MILKRFFWSFGEELFKGRVKVTDKFNVKFLGILLFTLATYQLAWATPLPNCVAMANQSADPILTLINCKADPENFDPNNDINITCNQKQDLANSDVNCQYNGKVIKHCESGKEAYCFNGKSIELSYNTPMMYWLCTDDAFPDPGPEVGYMKLGSCLEEGHLDFDAKGLRVPGKLSCYCQDHGSGLSWTCYNIKKKE